MPPPTTTSSGTRPRRAACMLLPGRWRLHGIGTRRAVIDWGYDHGRCCIRTLRTRAHASGHARAASMCVLTETSASNRRRSARRNRSDRRSRRNFRRDCLHKDSKTLVLADTIINLELEKIRQPWRFATKLTGMYYPRGQIFFGMRLPLILQKRKTRAAVQKIMSWQPERIILSQGRWFDSNATATLEHLFGWAL